MKIEKILMLCCILCAAYSCSTEEDIPSSAEQPVDAPSENVYFAFNQWIYAQMNHYYLWRDDLPDSTACNYDLAPNEFYTSLLSDKDRFSYMVNNPYYSPDASANLGFAYQNYRDDQNRTASLVLYVTAPEAAAAGIQRGDWLHITQVDATSATFTKATVTHGRFVYDDKAFTMALPTQTPKSTVLLDSIYPGDVGYLCYTQYEDTADLIPALTRFKAQGIRHLILDLRYNPGGYVRTAKFLSSCIAPESAYGNIFQIETFNDIISEENIRKTGRPEQIEYFSRPVPDSIKVIGGQPIIPLNLPRLYVLTSSHTASASESTVIALRPFMEVILIGENTVGKGVGMYLLYDKRYKYALQPITFQYYNQNWETIPPDGLVPDYYMADGYLTSKKNIGDTDEPLLNAALSIINGSTPTAQTAHAKRSENEYHLTPIGEPSYVTEFYNTHYNEQN